MSLHDSVIFNDAIKAIAARHAAKVAEVGRLKKEVRHAEALLNDARHELEEGVRERHAEEAAFDAACAEYIGQFDRNADGNVTPMEILKSVFTGDAGITDAGAVVKAMFTSDANGDAMVDVGEFTRAMRQQAGLDGDGDDDSR